TRRDIRLSSERSSSGLTDVKPGWFSRLGLRNGGLEQLRAVLDAQADRTEATANLADPGDMAHVRGMVLWPYEQGEWREYHRMSSVRVTFAQAGRGNTVVATTGPDGSYEIWLPQGAYHVTIEHPPFRSMAADVIVLPEGVIVRRGLMVRGEPRS